MKNCIKSFGKKLWEENVLKKAERSLRRKNTAHKKLRLCKKILSHPNYKYSICLKSYCDNEVEDPKMYYPTSRGQQLIKKYYKKQSQRKVREMRDEEIVCKGNFYKKYDNALYYLF